MADIDESDEPDDVFEYDEIEEIRLKNSETGKRVGTKIGGEPSWIQNEWKPECCGQRMLFLAQIDSLDIPEVDFPDSALVFVFVCTKCFETTSQMQCC